MAQQLDSIEGIVVTADDIEEAVEYVVRQLQSLSTERGSRGFTVPTLTRESIELVDGEWARVFVFAAEFLPQVN